MTPNENILVSQKFNNYNYAPGIATYGIDGKTGETGADGNNIYFTDFDFKNIEDLKIFASQLIQNYLPLKNSTIKISRSYKNDDLFFNQLGIIYRLNHIDELLNNIESITGWEAYFNIAGRLTIANDSSLFTLLDNRLILNSSFYSGYDIVVGSNPSDISNLINKNSAVNIISNKVDENNNIEMVNIQSIDDIDIEDGKLSVYYKTTENAFYLDSNKPIVIDGDVKLNNDNNTNNEYDNYSTILTSNDTITYFKYICDKLRYNVLYDSDVNRYKLVIYQEDGESDKLEYLINRNETVYGKVYDGENNQILLRLSDVVNGSVRSEDYANYSSQYDCSITNKSLNTVSLYQENEPYITILPDNVSINNQHDEDKHKLDISVAFTENAEELASFSVIVNNNELSETYKINQDETIYKYVFTSSNENNLSIQLQPTKKFQCNTEESFTYPPIKLSIGTNNLQEDLKYIIYFKLNFNNDTSILYINDFMLFDRELVLSSDSPVPYIQIYIPDNVNSVQRFSLLHNTEVFINYQE